MILEIMLRLILLSLVILFPTLSTADEMRPGYLELSSNDDQIYTIKWKIPGKGNQVLRLKPVFPETCRIQTPKTSYLTRGAQISQWSIFCPQGLAGKPIIIAGLENTSTDVLIRLTSQNGTTQIMRVTPNETETKVTVESSSLDVIRIYTRLGIEHILMGIDHLLFVFALLLIVKGWRQLLATITAFTLAHSITLASATLGLVYVPIAPVEAVIALSIVFLATEIIHNRRGKAGLTQRLPWIVAFIFGLLHGLGFASALAEVGLPEYSIPLALLFFNVGVELGQLIFVVVVMSAGWILKQIVSAPFLRQGEWLITYAIGSMAAFWLLERVSIF